MTEIWRRVPISPWKAYEVSSLGRVRRGTKVMAPVGDTDGYLTVKLSYAGIPKRFRISRLVCEAFNGPPPKGYDCAHTDGVKSNNAASNLQWATRAENIAHKVAHGTAQRGERGAAAKLTAGEVLEIRRRGNAGEKPIVIARDYPVGRSHIASILRGDRGLWVHDGPVPEGNAPNV